jgi:diadenosine tetraphosphate (Ap4A) HIT family hydrolase
MREAPPEGCPFCRLTNSQCVIVSDLSCVIPDAFPVNPGHLLIIPKRHAGDFFDLTENEIADLMGLLQRAKAVLDETYNPAGFNVGINVGTAAGQTIPHVHIHLIPRYLGDVMDPVGGVRGVLPWKAKYPVHYTEPE